MSWRDEINPSSSWVVSSLQSVSLGWGGIPPVFMLSAVSWEQQVGSTIHIYLWHFSSSNGQRRTPNNSGNAKHLNSNWQDCAIESLLISQCPELKELDHRWAYPSNLAGWGFSENYNTSTAWLWKSTLGLFGIRFAPLNFPDSLGSPIHFDFC